MFERNGFTLSVKNKGNIMAFNPEHLKTITALAKDYGATRLILFGSAQSSPESARDLDLACDGITGWKLYELAARIEDAIDLPLDIVPLSPQTRFTKIVERKGQRLL